MYTLTSHTGGHLLHSDTLEELREHLVHFHFANRKDPQFGDFIDQAHAVYPLDESEIDEGDTVPEPRPLTEDLLIQLARHVWDTPDVELEESTDIAALATTLHYLYDMDIPVARDILRTYIDQLRQYEGRPIDEDTISRDDADFLISSIKAARSAGELGEVEMAALATAGAAYRDAQDTAEYLRIRRDSAINAAVACGASKADVARAAGISKQAVAKIVLRMQD